MFYQTGVDISNIKSMWEFLHNHFHYSTLNSWNCLESIANNVKLYNLKLEGDWAVALSYLMDEWDAGGLQLAIDEEIKLFESEHPCYRAYFNGRSNGYLILGNADNNLSILPECLDYDSYEDFKSDIKDYNIYGKVSDYAYELRQAVEIVREFDKLCDRLRDIVNEYSLKSFDTDKLESAVALFENKYGTDLLALGVESPVMVGDRLKMNCLKDYFIFMNCFIECLGDDYKRVTTNDEYLWLKEL